MSSRICSPRSAAITEYEGVVVACQDDLTVDTLMKVIPERLP